MYFTKGKRILIIDDDEDINDLFKIFLEYDGYKVDAFTDPIGALYSFRKNVYDLVLLDLKMPKMNGMILYQKLKNIDPDLLFCIITANREYIDHLKKNNPNIEKFNLDYSVGVGPCKPQIWLIPDNSTQDHQMCETDLEMLDKKTNFRLNELDIFTKNLIKI